MRRGLLLFVCSLIATAGLAAEDWRWQGTAAPGRYGDFPETGRFAASNSFPVESRVEVENTETGERTTVFITRGLDEAGLLMVLSPHAARELGMHDDGTAEVRVRRAERLTRPPRLRDPEAAFSRDPDRNPLAALAPPAEEDPSPPSAEQEPAPPTAELERPDPEQLPVIPVPEDEPRIDEPREVVELIPEPAPEPAPEVELAPLLEPEPEPAPPEHKPRVQPRFEIAIDEDEFPYPEVFEPEDPLAEDLPEIATRPPHPVSPPVVPDELTEPVEPVEPVEPPTEKLPEPAPEPEEVPTVEPLEALPPELFPPEPAEEPEEMAVEEIDRIRVHDELESGKFYVQLGAFRSREGAGALVARLDERLPSTVIAAQVDEEPLYRVYVGPLSEDEVGATLYTMRRRGYRDAFVTRP